MKQTLYTIYQFVFAYPLMLLLAIFTAIVTMICFPCKRSRWLHGLQSFWAKCCCWLMFVPVSVDGVENVDPHQSYVFVSNHQSTYDIFLIYGWLPTIFKWLMKVELKKIPFFGWASRAAGHVFVDRKNIRAGVASLREAEKVLQGGVSTVIFPEGTRSKDGNVMPFKRGAFQVALHLGLPVIPLSLSGCHELMPDDAVVLHRHPLHMHIGKPIRLQDFAEEKEAIEAVRQAVIDGKRTWKDGSWV